MTDQTTIATPAAAPQATPITPPIPLPTASPPAESPPPPAAAEAPKPPEDPRFSSKFAALARREREIQKRETQMKAEQEKLSTLGVPKDAVRAKFKTNAIEALQEYAGLSYDDLTKLILNDNKATPDMLAKELQKQIDEMKNQSAEKEKKNAEESYNAAVKNYLGEVSGFLAQNGKAFELTQSHPEGVELVYHVVQEHYDKNDRILPMKEAAEAVEKYLEAEAEKLLALEKFKAKFAPPAPAAPGAPAIEKKGASPTLTNHLQTEVPAPTDPGHRSYEESRVAAAKLLKWT